MKLSMMSVSVRIPTSFPSSTTGRQPIFFSRRIRAASSIGAEEETV